MMVCVVSWRPTSASPATGGSSPLSRWALIGGKLVMWPHAPLWLVQLMGKTNLPVVAAVCVSAPVLAADALQPGDSPELHHHPQHQHLLSQHQPLDLASVRPHCPHLLQDRSALLVFSWDFLQFYYHLEKNELISSALLINFSMFCKWNQNVKRILDLFLFTLQSYIHSPITSSNHLGTQVTQYFEKWLHSAPVLIIFPGPSTRAYKVFTVPRSMVTKPTIGYDHCGQASQFHVYLLCLMPI